MDNPLIEVSEHVRAQAQNSRVAVIFDLDSTLFCVSPRTQAILRSLGTEPHFAAAYSEAAEILKNIEVLPTDYGIRKVLERTQMQPTPELVEVVRDYWDKHFFSSDFLQHDVLYPSADEYVRHLRTLGADILYLTGRNELNMRAGTVKALRFFGFPLEADEKLMMKPTDVQTDEAYKANALKALVPKYDHIWFFENEPLIIDQVRPLVPQVHIVFVHSVHAGKAAVPTGLRTIKPDFTIVKRS